MQYSTNYNLKKPDYTDFADIQDINDNMDTIDAQLAAPTGDSADSTTTFTCSDVADGSASSWTTVPALTSGETHKSLFAKMSQMFKNIRYLYKLLGTTDISSIGNGTVTGGLTSLNDSFTNSMSGLKLRLYSFSGTTDAYAQLVINNPFNSINVLLLTTHKHITGANYYMIGIDNVTMSSITFRVYQVNGSGIQSLPNASISTYSMLFAIWDS